MKSLPLCLIFTFIELCSSASLTLQLYNYKSATPTKVNNVEDGSKVYLSSNDKALMLSRITLSSNGQTKNLQQLLGDFDANGYSNGFPVNSDLTIATTNTEAETETLNGLLFISNAAMAKDPNFLVYLVSDQVKTIDRSTTNETTLLLLNKRVERTATDPVNKPLYNARMESIIQPKSTSFWMYQGVPSDGYTDPTYEETIRKMIFSNPVSLFPTGNNDADNAFFDNIEPIQFSMSIWYIRATGGGITLKVSSEWRDLSKYETTKETTTGYTMTQYTSDNSTTNFRNTPGHEGMFGYMMTTADRQTGINVTSCNEIDCVTEPFTMQVFADKFQYNRNDTVMYVDYANQKYGYFYLQYFRIEKGISSPTSSSTTTTVKPPETTTKSTFRLLPILAALVTTMCTLLL